MAWDPRRAWPNQEMQMARRRLVELRELVENLSTANQPTEQVEQAASELSRFLVVRSVGHIEYVFETAISEYAEAHARRQVVNFLKSHLGRGNNPSPGKLVARLGDFDHELGSRLETFLREDDQYLKNELSAMVDRRNDIAHGKNVGIGNAKSIKYAELALVIGDKLIELIDPR